MSTNSFTCRQCSNPHELTKEEIAGRRVTPWTRRCQCGALYQITRDEIRWVALGKLPPLPLPPLPKL